METSPLESSAHGVTSSIVDRHTGALTITLENPLDRVHDPETQEDE